MEWRSFWLFTSLFPPETGSRDVSSPRFLIQVTQGDVSVERDTYKQSRQGLDEMYNEAQRQLKEECQLRQVRTLLAFVHERHWHRCLTEACVGVCGLTFRMWRMSWWCRCRWNRKWSWPWNFSKKTFMKNRSAQVYRFTPSYMWQIFHLSFVAAIGQTPGLS